MIQGTNQTAGQYWTSSSFTFKFYFITSMIVIILSFSYPLVAVYCIDIPLLTIWDYQLWRLFSSMYGQVLELKFGYVLNIVFSFLWLNSVLKDTQHSTVYTIIQVILINFEVHLVFNLISFILPYLFTVSVSMIFLFGYGWLPVIIVYQFRKSAENPQGVTRFCFLPFTIKNKHFPWVLLALMVIISWQPFCYVASGIVGYYQEVVRKQMFIKLPYGFYKGLQYCLPNAIKKRTDFVKINRVQTMLKCKCWKPRDRPNIQIENQVQHNYFPSQNAINFRNHWAQKDEPKQNQAPDERMTKELNEQHEIQPRQYTTSSEGTSNDLISEKQLWAEQKQSNQNQRAKTGR